MERTAPGSSSRLKVVVVEDDSTIREFLKDTLEKELGY